MLLRAFTQWEAFLFLLSSQISAFPPCVSSREFPSYSRHLGLSEWLLLSPPLYPIAPNFFSDGVHSWTVKISLCLLSGGRVRLGVGRILRLRGPLIPFLGRVVSCFNLFPGSDRSLSTLTVYSEAHGPSLHKPFQSCTLSAT